MIILKIIGLFFWLLLVPVAIGTAPISFNQTMSKSFGGALVRGYIVLLALLEFVGIPIVLFMNEGAYMAFCIVFGAVLLLLATFGAYSNRKALLKISVSEKIKACINSIFKLGWEERLYLALVIVVVFAQMLMSLKYASYDADDFYYNSEALSAQAFGTLYRIDSSTGHNMPLDFRHAMALFPIFQSFIGTVTGLHVAVVSHTVMPLLLIPLSYVLIYLISVVLFPEKRELRLIFTLLIAIFRIFGNVSYFTAETFFLIRTWQGKALAGNFILPAVIYFYLKYYSEKAETKGALLLLALLVLASGSSSSLAVLLVCGLSALLSLLFFIMDKDFKKFLRFLIPLIPGVIYMLIYIVGR